jgi:hypothetical protein
MIFVRMRGSGKRRLLPPNQKLRTFRGLSVDRCMLQPVVGGGGTVTRACLAYERVVKAECP